MTTPRFSLVYPTRHRPEFVAQALTILEAQGHQSFEVVVCDNWIDERLSCERICRESSLSRLVYVRPPQPVGMVDNWNYALTAATGEYISFLTDKMFFLPGALGRVERAIEDAGGADVVSWTGDSYNPETFPNYFGTGRYVQAAGWHGGSAYRLYSPRAELDRRGRAEVARGQQSSSDYARGKLVFGAYHRRLIERMLDRYGALFHNISPDYTSMILGLSEAASAIELRSSCIVSVNTDISNGMLAATNDRWALAFLSSLAGGVEEILANLLIPGLYASQHNVVAHDFLTLRRTFDLDFQFQVANWLVYCVEDINQPERQWSDPRVEAAQKDLLAEFLASLDHEVAAAVNARLAARRVRPHEPRSLRRLVGRFRPRRMLPPSPSIRAAIENVASRIPQ